MLVFFGGFIPYIGGLITTTILVLVTYSYGGLGDVVILQVLITIMNVIQGNFLAPLMYGKTVDLHPAIVFVAMPAGGAVAGIIGLFLAIPVVAFFAAISGAIVAALGERSARAPTDSEMVPPWLDRIGQVSWRLLAAFALGAILIAVTLTLSVVVVVVGVILGVILAAALVPIVDRLRARGWGRSRAAIAVTGLVGFAVVVVMAGAVFAVASEVIAARRPRWPGPRLRKARPVWQGDRSNGWHNSPQSSAAKPQGHSGPSSVRSARSRSS